MIKNYITIAFRNMYRNPVHSFINIFGLAVGIACCILLLLYVQNEWSFDRFHSNSDRLYRAWVHEDYGDGEIYFNTVTPLVLAETLESHIPEVESTSRFFNFTDLVKIPDANESLSQTVSMTDPAFFRMFDFHLVDGNAETVFDLPNSVVITEETAVRYFGDQIPMNDVLSIRIGEQFEDFIVTGIIEVPPVNSSIHFDMLIPFSNSRKIFSENAHTSWFNVSPETYVRLRDDTSLQPVEPKLTSMMHSVLGDRYGDEYLQSDFVYTVGLQPITDIRFNIDFPTGIAEVNDPVYSYILAAIALLVLLIACVNFVTLSLSHSTSRIKEIGIRKTIGAQRKALIYQFWGEALLMTVFGLIFGLLIAELILPKFNMLSGTELSIGFSWNTLGLIAAMTLFVSLVAGLYPALILSGFKPVDIFRGRLYLPDNVPQRALFRQIMVAFQFTISIALIAGTLVIGEQLDYIRTKNLGYQKEHILVVPTDMRAGPQNPLMNVLEEAGRLKERIISDLRGYTSVEQVSMSSYTPVQQGGWISADFREPSGRKRNFHINIVDHHFVETYRIKVLQGRNFSTEITSDARRAILVNQALVDDYGWEHPVGQRLPGEDFENHEIIGVVENFHFESLHTGIAPLVLTINPVIIFNGIDNIGFAGSPSQHISFRINTENLPATMNIIEENWKSVAVGVPFNYTFVDRAVDTQYRQEERLSQIAAFGSTFAIIIACLGLFGLVSLTIVCRTKEIGIRKVLGANVMGIVTMLSKDFLKLVIVGFLIATPIAWYVMNRWLEDFAYRIEIGAGAFISAGVAAIIIACATVCYHAFRSALANPVEALRNE